MKKLISLLMVFSILLACCAVSAGTVFALDGDYFYKELSDGTAEITGYAGSGGDITIPAELGGLEVSSIGTKAFYQNQSIKNVTHLILVETVDNGHWYYSSFDKKYKPTG